MVRFRLPVHTVCERIEEIREIIRKPSTEIKTQKEQEQELFTEKV